MVRDYYLASPVQTSSVCNVDRQQVKDYIATIAQNGLHVFHYSDPSSAEAEQTFVPPISQFLRQQVSNQLTKLFEPCVESLSFDFIRSQHESFVERSIKNVVGREALLEDVTVIKIMSPPLNFFFSATQ